MSFKPAVEVFNDPGKYHHNNLAFATHAEAERSAKDLMSRWMLVTSWRVDESDQPVNYRLDESGQLEEVK
jgi:hypothetical protein